MHNYKNFFLTILLVFASFAVGSIHPWSIAACLALSSALFAFEAFERGLKKNAPGVGIAGWMFVGLCAFTLLQIVPLPAAVVELLSPRAAEVKRSLYENLLSGGAPGWMSLSLDPYATILGLMKLTAGVLLFLSVRQRIRKEGSSNVLWCVAWSGVAVALVFFIHRLLGWERVFELYSPVYAPTTPLSAPLLNANHLAGYLGLSAAVSVGLAFSEKEKMKRLLLIFAAGFTGGGVFLTLSRGGILCFLGGQVLFIAMRLIARAKHKGRRTRTELKLLPMALAVGVASGTYVAYQSVLQEFLHGDTAKLQIPADALPMLGDFWAAGVGRGAFQQGYTMYQQVPDGVTYTSPENFVAQYLTEWGAVAGGALLLVIAAVLLFGLLRPPMRARNAGALAAVFALVVQNFADFSLELTGVFLPFMTLLSSVVVTIEHAYGLSHTGKRNKGFTRQYVPGIAGATGVAAALVLAGLGYYYTSRRNLESETQDAKELFARQEGERLFSEEMHGFMQRHPADYYFPLLAGVKAYHGFDRNPLPFLSRALFLFPNSSLAHLYVGRTLAGSGFTDQALLEYMEAAKSRPSITGRIAGEVVRISGSFETARKMTRTDKDRMLLYGPLASAFRAAGMEEESRKADEALLAIDPFAEDAVARQTRRLIDEGALDEARGMIELVEGEESLSALALQLEGDLARKLGNAEKAAAKFVAAWNKNKRKRHLLLKAARLYGQLGDRKKMYKYIEQYIAGAPDEHSKGMAMFHRAALEDSLGLNEKALASYLSAASYLPDEPSLWRAVARLSAKKNDTAGMLKAYKELKRLQPDNATWQEKVEEIRSRLNSSILTGTKND